MSRRSLLDERSQALEGIVPLLRDSIQISARLLEPPRLQLPDTLALASATFAAHEARRGERMKVLRDGLARDRGARARMHDGEEEERLESFLGVEVRIRADEASLAKFSALRALCEPYVQALSNFLIMPLPEWVPGKA